MSRGKSKIPKAKVNKTIFKSILKECGTNIIQLGELSKTENGFCTARTIHRALEEGEIALHFLDQIAKHLNVDPRLLSGKLHEEVYLYNDPLIRKLSLTELTAKNYPYFRKKKSDLDQQPMSELLEQLFALYEISYSQFEDMNFEQRYQLQHDLLDALVPVMRKHFNVDAYGRKDMPNLMRIIIELENYRNNHYIELHAENVLRKKYLENPPKGKTKSDIREMSVDDLIWLDMETDVDM